MANYFNLELDTTGPSNPSIIVDSGAQYTTDVAGYVNVAVSTGDAVTTNYQMKLWGDVDPTENVDIQPLEANAGWITFVASRQVKVSSGDGGKTINLRIRDDVHNESSTTSDDIIKDSTKPEVTIAGPDVNIISKKVSKNTSSFTFSSTNSGFEEYKVKAVGTTGSAEDTGTLIPTTNGSTNTSGNVGGYLMDDPISVSINGSDLELASSGDGIKIIKVFIKDDAGNWSN